MVKTFHPIQHESPIPTVIEGYNIVNTNSLDTIEMSSVHHHLNSLDCSLSDS